MNWKIYRSKGFVYVFVLLFIFLITVEAMPIKFSNSFKNEREPVVQVKRAGRRISAQQVERFEELFTEGKRLLQEEYDYDSAIEKFTEALRYAPSSKHRADVYLHLSLAYYATR